MCITIAANIAETGILSFPACFPDSVVGFIADPEVCDVRFVEYAMRVLRLKIQHEATGSVQDNINLETLGRLQLDLPPLTEQRAIANVLGALDDKIELNRRMNQTLEAIARTIFQSWFVDFDPVRAKARGEAPPGLAPDIAALFPSSFDQDERGVIPSGWNFERLDSLLTLQRGFDLPASARTPGPFPVVAASGINGTHDKFMVKGPGVTTGRSGVLGKVFYVSDDFWPLNTSLWVKEFTHSRPIFAYFLLSTLDFGVYNAGSAVPTLNRNHVHNLQVVKPPMTIIETFEELARPLMQKQRQNDSESALLSSIRDLLLPKLISGEIRVPVAEEMVEEFVT